MADAADKVAIGAICARCHRPFDGDHGKPVYCHLCYKDASLTGSPPYPKGWQELQ